MLWKPEEIRILKSSRTIDQMCAELPHRSRKSILNKRSKIGAGSRGWSREERAILEEYYADEGESICERLPGRSWDSIRSQVYYLRKRGWNI